VSKEALLLSVGIFYAWPNCGVIIVHYLHRRVQINDVLIDVTALFLHLLPQHSMKSTVHIEIHA